MKKKAKGKTVADKKAVGVPTVADLPKKLKNHIVECDPRLKKGNVQAMSKGYRK